LGEDWGGVGRGWEEKRSEEGEGEVREEKRVEGMREERGRGLVKVGKGRECEAW